MKPLSNSAGLTASPKIRRGIFRTGLLALLCANIAPAALFVSVEATGSPFVSGTSSDFGDPSVLSAFANSGGSADVSPGPLVPATAQFPHVTGRAEARTNGTLRAAGGNVVSGMIGGGQGTAEILDTLLFLSAPVLEISIDGNLHVNGLADANVEFTIYTPASAGPEASDTLWFSYIAHKDDSGSYYTVTDFNGNTDIVFGSIPNTFARTVNLPPIPGPFELAFSLTASGGCQATPCFGRADFENTVHIGIVGDYVSSSGYTYTGGTEAPRVPEPGAGLLAGSGLVILAIRRLARKFARDRAGS